MRVIQKMRAALGHVGLWAASYCAGAVVCLWQLGDLAGAVNQAGASPGLTPSWRVLAFVLLTATGVYALDRVKVRDAWIDPADIAAQPARYAFVCGHSRGVRVAAFMSLAGGAAVGFFITPWAPLATGLAVGGVLLYAARPRGRSPRPKDVLGIKNLYVAAGIVGFAALAALADAGGKEPGAWIRVAREHTWPLATACVLLGVRVLIDAALCDLDDEAADRHYGTATFPTWLGGRFVWRSTVVARAVLLAAIAVAAPCPWRARAAWVIAGMAGTFMLRVWRPSHVRDRVDVRMAAEAGIATAVMAALAAWR